MSDIDNTLPPDETIPPPEPGPVIANDDTAPAAAPVEAEAALEPVEPVEPALPDDHVKVELLHDVSLCVNSIWHTFVAGWNVVHKNIVALIKQTHQKSALRE